MFPAGGSGDLSLNRVLFNFTPSRRRCQDPLQFMTGGGAATTLHPRTSGMANSVGAAFNTTLCQGTMPQAHQSLIGGGAITMWFHDGNGVTGFAKAVFSSGPSQLRGGIQWR